LGVSSLSPTTEQLVRQELASVSKLISGEWMELEKAVLIEAMRNEYVLRVYRPEALFRYIERCIVYAMRDEPYVFR